MLKGLDGAILACLGGVMPFLALASGCSASRQAVDVYLEAVALRQRGQDELEVEKLKQAIAADPGFALARSELGHAYLRMGDVDKAASAFERAVLVDAWSFSDHMDLAQVCQKQGQPDRAARLYRWATLLAPESLAAQLGAAECHLRVGELAVALAHAEVAKRLEERPQAVLHLLGRIYEAQGNVPQAVATYQQWAALDADAAGPRLAIALVYTRNDRLDEAQRILLSVLQQWPREAVALRHLAYCRLKLGDADQAIEMYEKAIGIEGNDWEAHRGLGVAYMVKFCRYADARLRNLALYHWRQALAIYPDQPGGDVLQRLIKEQATTMNPLQGLDY